MELNGKINGFQKLLLLASAVLLGFSSHGFADSGGNSGGGGKGILCQEAKGPRLYLADTFALVRSGAADGLKLADPDAVIAAAAAVIDKLYPEKTYPNPYLPGQKVTFGWMLEHQAAALDYEYTGKLQDLPDDHIDLNQLPKNCRTKVQIAIQDVTTGRVSVDIDNSYQKLTWLEDGFLHLHETLISLRNAPGADTTSIRRAVNKIAALLRDPKFPLHKLILLKLDPGSIPPMGSLTVHSPTEAAYETNCGMGAMDLSPAHEALCQKLRDLMGQEFMAANASTAIKTLMRIPQTLKCILPITKSKDADIESKGFVLRRISGDGRPKSHNVLSFETTDSVDHSSLQNTEVTLATYQHDRDAGYRIYGEFKIEASFQGSKLGLNPSLTIDGYNPDTNEFTGSIALDEKKYSESSEAFSNIYHVSCYPDSVEYDYDREQSNY